MRFIRGFIAECRGGTMIEYGLICSLIVVAILASLSTFTGRVVSMMFNVSNAVNGAG